MNAVSKTAAFLCAMLLSASSLTVIVTGAVDHTRQTIASVTDNDSQSRSDLVKIGKVTAINGNQLTLTLGKCKSKHQTSDSALENAEADVRKRIGKKTEETPSDNTQTQENTAPNSDSQDFRNNHKKQHRKSGHGIFTESGTSLTIQITDDITLENKGETASVSDISTGDILSLFYDDNGTLVRVKISRRNGKNSFKTNSTKQKDTVSAT